MIIIIISILAIGTTCFAQAEHDHDEDSRENGMMEHDMENEHDMHMMGMMNMMGNMKLMERHVIPTSDGGVVVLVADTLYKCDALLNFQNQVELPVDYVKMYEMMEMPGVQSLDNHDPHAHD